MLKSYLYIDYLIDSFLIGNINKMKRQLMTNRTDKVYAVIILLPMVDKKVKRLEASFFAKYMGEGLREPEGDVRVN